MQKGLEIDIVELRFKHFQSRLIDTINRVLEERRNISIFVQLSVFRTEIDLERNFGIKRPEY